MKDNLISVIKAVIFCAMMLLLGHFTSDGTDGDIRGIVFLCAAIICIIAWSEILKLVKSYKKS
ncbi:hypothetical protein C1Y41_06990 [Pantoea sp. ICBG 1758]|nr:hypothetical protein C1Y41_06990 [Pantoea sp. ICBG 1758]